MFITYEGNTTIAWASIKNLSRNPATDQYATGITGGNGLGGMAVDENNSRLYVISRRTSRLFAFDYDIPGNTLDPVRLGETTDYVTLENLTSGIDIALDETNQRLYVSDLTPTVRYYNTSTWQLEGSITLDQSAVGIGLDQTRNYLYAGYFPGYGGQNYLMRYDLTGDPNDPETYLEKNLDTPVMDIAVDEDTGYVYLTLKRIDGYRYGVVEVYDPTNWTSSYPEGLVLLDAESDDDFVNEGPGGIALGPRYKPANMFIGKVDNITDPNYCAVPDDIITYTICYAPGAEPNVYYNVVITDRLPPGVDFVAADPNTGYYTERPIHTYTWDVGFVPGHDPNDPSDPNQCLDITVQVNQWAEPLGELVNFAEIESDESYTQTQERTPVCCWAGDIIYVDISATGSKTGVDWDNAYTNLQDALARTAAGCGSEIWVAQGTYSPGSNTTDSFVIPDGVQVYGGFYGNETARHQQDHTRYVTILNGFIREDPYFDIRNLKVVTMGNNTVLDGFVIKEGQEYGVYGINTDFTVSNCVIIKNEIHGLFCQNGDIILEWNIFRENKQSGIHHIGSGTTIKVSNCEVYNNLREGIYCDRSVPTILNSMIYDNGSYGNNYYGVKLYYPSDNPVIRNNTIVYNHNEGIYFTGENKPAISNCILWGNDAQDAWRQMYQCEATYSCIYDPVNDPGGTAPPEPNETGNITTNPQFIDPNNYNYHLEPNSPCINLGLDGDYENETDIDGEPRVMDPNANENPRIDMGADEVACGVTTNPADFNDDGVVDILDYAELAHVWLLDNTDPGWNALYDLIADNIINLPDLHVFFQNWIWSACWNDSYMSSSFGQGMMTGMDMETGMPLTSPLTQSVDETSLSPVPLTPEQQIQQLQDSIAFLEDIWQTSPEIRSTFTADDWSAWIESMEDHLSELEMLNE